MSGQLIKSTLMVSGLTLVSRLLGFVRDMLIARLFGVNIATDAFFVAFKIPNLFRRLFTEGAFAHALVPLISGYQQQNPDDGGLRRFLSKLTGSLLAWTSFLALAGVLLAPVLVYCLAPGFASDGERYDLAVALLRMQLPYGVCIALVALAGAVLNAHGHYAVPALTPAFLNIVMIAAALWLTPHLAQPITALAWGVVLAGMLQVAIQLPGLWRLRLLLKPVFSVKDPEVRRANRLLVPAVFSASITQINLLFDTLIASFLAEGSVSWLYYSDRLVEFPLGILGIGLGSVILPTLAGNHVANKPEDFSRTLDWGLRLVLLVGMPATIGLFLLAAPMLSTLFQYREFTVTDVQSASLSLRAYSVGLLGYLVAKILVSGFTSRLDLKTPVRYGLYAMAASLLLNVLAIPLAHAGLALATSLGAIINAALLLGKLLADRVYRPGRGWVLFFFRILLASVMMALFIHYCVDINWWHGWGASGRVFNLVKWILLSCLVYFATLWLSGIRLRHLLMTNDKIPGLQ